MKEIKDAFEFGSFNFAKESLAILDNLKRAKDAIKNDTALKDNKDLDKFLENINIIEKDLVSIFEKNNIKRIEAKGKKFDPNLHQAMTEIEDEKNEGSFNNAMKYILKRLDNKKNRSAFFVCSLTYKSQNNKFINVQGKIHGKISNKILGKNGFGYDPIFIPNSYNETYGQMKKRKKMMLC